MTDAVPPPAPQQAPQQEPAAAAPPAANGTAPVGDAGQPDSSANGATTFPSEAVNKILNVPLVSGTLKYAQQTLAGYPQVANAVNAGGNLAASGLRAAEPYAARFNPQLQSLDGLAVKGLNYAEQSFPAAFTASTADVANGVRSAPATAQQAFAQSYAARVLNPATAKLDQLSHSEYVKKVVETITSLQGTLSTALAKTKDSTEPEGAATREASAASNSLLAEIDGVRTYLLSLPAETLARLQPVKETFTDAFAALAKEVKEPNAPTSTKFANILKYVKEQALPALQKAIQNPLPEQNGTAEPPTAEPAAEKPTEAVDEKNDGPPSRPKADDSKTST